MRRTACLATLAALLALMPVPNAQAEYGDIRFTRKDPGAEDFAPALFPHWLHRMRFRCYVCHQEIFKMRAGANPVTMSAIKAGKYCGACHDGKTAFAPMFEHCWRCHRK